MSNDPAADILASVRAVVEERDALRARVAELETLTRRQSTVLAHAADLLHELDAFAAEVCEEPAPERSRATTDVPLAPGTRLVTVSLGDEEPAPEPAIAQAARRAAAARGARERRAYSDADVHQWIAELRAGCSIWEIHKRTGVSYALILGRVQKAGGVIERGRLVSIQEGVTNAPPEITADTDEEPDDWDASEMTIIIEEREPEPEIATDTDDVPPFLLHSRESDAESVASS